MGISTQDLAKQECEPATRPVAEEVLNFSSSLAELAGAVASRVGNVLSPIMISSVPEQETNKVVAASPDREYPPLFYELNERLRIIEAALSSISDCMNRTEL